MSIGSHHSHKSGTVEWLTPPEIIAALGPFDLDPCAPIEQPYPPKSACSFCPYRSDVEWRRLRDHDPEAFAEAVAVDAAIRQNTSAGKLKRGYKAAQYIHRSLKPLSEVDFSNSAERGQPDLFNNDCEGMCGL